MEFSEYCQFLFVLHEKYEKSLKCITIASWPQIPKWKYSRLADFDKIQIFAFHSDDKMSR